MIRESKYEQFGTIEFHSLGERDRHKIMTNLFGKRYAAYRKTWRALHGNPIRPSFPLHIDIDLQDACNQRCVMCHQSYRKRNGAVMTWKLLKKIIDEGSEKGLCALGFGSAAEPLLQKDLLMEGIAYADKKNIMDIFLRTNATLLDPTVAASLIDSGLRHIAVSIDAATEETYKRTRKSNAYDKVVKNVLNFVKIRERKHKLLPTVRVSFCVNPTNYTEKNRFQKYWKNKVDIVYIQNYRHVKPTPVKDNEFRKQETQCSEPYRRIMIWPDGNLSLCCGYRFPDVVLGNILKHSISSLWNGDKMNKIRDAFEGHGPLPSTCKECLNSNYQLID